MQKLAVISLVVAIGSLGVAVYAVIRKPVVDSITLSTGGKGKVELDATGIVFTDSAGKLRATLGVDELASTMRLYPPKGGGSVTMSSIDGSARIELHANDDLTAVRITDQAFGAGLSGGQIEIANHEAAFDARVQAQANGPSQAVVSVGTNQATPHGTWAELEGTYGALMLKGSGAEGVGLAADELSTLVHRKP